MASNPAVSALPYVSKDEAIIAECEYFIDLLTKDGETELAQRLEQEVAGLRSQLTVLFRFDQLRLPERIPAKLLREGGDALKNYAYEAYGVTVEERDLAILQVQKLRSLLADISDELDTKKKQTLRIAADSIWNGNSIMGLKDDANALLYAPTISWGLLGLGLVWKPKEWELDPTVWELPDQPVSDDRLGKPVLEVALEHASSPTVTLNVFFSEAHWPVMWSQAVPRRNVSQAVTEAIAIMDEPGRLVTSFWAQAAARGGRLQVGGAGASIAGAESAEEEVVEIKLPKRPS